MPLQSIDAYEHLSVVPDAWLIEHLWKRENLAIMVGQPKFAHKSWLALDLGWSLATGASLWDYDVFRVITPARVAYFCQEDTAQDIRDRVITLRQSHPASPLDGNFWLCPRDMDLDLATPRGIAAITRQLDLMKPGPDLIILDPLRQLHGADENDATEMSNVVRNVRFLMQSYHSACLLIHHTKKASGEASVDESNPASSRGSSALFGSADLFINAQGLKGGESVKLTFTAKRCKAPRPIILDLALERGGHIAIRTGR